MSIVFAAYTPHPPLLIPEIAQGHGEQIKATQEAMNRLAEELYVTSPDLIIIISPHTGIHNDAFTINASPIHTGNFKKFGELETSFTWEGAPHVASQISHLNMSSDFEVQLVSDEELDHGVTIPLSLLTKQLKHVPVLPVGFSGMDATKHLHFGNIIKEFASQSTKRIAIIATGDLSHCHNKQAPGGYHIDGQSFDEQFIAMLETKNTSGLVQMDKEMIKNAQECGYRVGVILSGILQNVNYRFERLAYEKPYGVGYLTGLFHF